MTDAGDGPPDPQLDPMSSPGVGDADAVEIDRDDVSLGDADPRSLTAADTAPLAGEPVDRLLGLLDGDDAVERRRAALALAERSLSAAGVDALADAARHDPDDEVRQFAVEALGKQSGESAAATAQAVLEADDDPWVRAEALVALDRLNRDGFEPAIANALDDDHHAVRRNALVSLFKLRGAGALDELLAASEDDSARVREWAAHMLGGIDDDSARERLRALLGDADDVVARTAREALDRDPDRFRRQFVENDASTVASETPLNQNPGL